MEPKWNQFVKKIRIIMRRIMECSVPIKQFTLCCRVLNGTKGFPLQRHCQLLECLIRGDECVRMREHTQVKTTHNEGERFGRNS